MKKKKKNRILQEEYTYEQLREDRAYGFYWYNWLWSFLRPVLIGICVLVVVVGVISSVWNSVNEAFIAPVDPTDTTDIIFEVKSGNSLTRVANNLEAAGLVRNRSVFKYYADFLGYGQKIQVGKYVLNRSMSIGEIADRLTAGDGTPLVRQITVIEGWTVENIADYLVREGVIANREEMLALCRSGSDYAAYYYVADAQKAPYANERLYMLEGYLSPNTYEIYTSATVSDIVKKLLSQTEAVFKNDWHDRADALNMTMDQVMTLASMIEKEAKTNDFKKVSAVFHNRLNTGMTLGSDVTVKYVTGTTKMSLNSDDLKVNSRYNTYTYAGLPIGPICNPSAAAIEAALYPDETFVAEKYLYFCSKDPDTGELYFSKTLAEHETAVSIYAPLWKAYDEKTGAK
ncbi:MAG: endolytic transglycosylase MltG [Clostridia bacterium]|nr:endolytic transglycosylase MltG [Clostridia bacterium]